MAGYKNLKDMVEEEFKLSQHIVNRRAFGDEEKLAWWEGRLDAWKRCKEQLERDNKEPIDNSNKLHERTINEKEVVEMKVLTFGQVIDNIKIGQVAIKINGEYGELPFEDLVRVQSILYIDEDDHMLRGDSGGRVMFYYPPHNHKKDKYILVDKEVFESLKEQLETI